MSVRVEVIAGEIYLVVGADRVLVSPAKAHEIRMELARALMQWQEHEAQVTAGRK